MAESSTSIVCPKCGNPINVSDILYHQVQDKLRMEFEDKIAENENAFKAKLEEVNKAREQLKKEQDAIQEKIEEKVNSSIIEEKAKLEKSISAKFQEESFTQIQALQKELQEKSSQVKELNQTKAEIERLKREKDELRDAIRLENEKEYNEKLRIEKQRIQQVADENLQQINTLQLEMEKITREKAQLSETIALEKEREMTEKLNQEKVRIRTELEEHNALRIKDLEKQLEDQKKQAEEMIRKAEQKSMQLQGEVQELAIEEWLRQQFPLDTIEEVKKGQLGADCIQTVNTYTKGNCGKICYESKRTKNFSSDWIPKLKEDTRRANANLGVLVTQVLPKDMERMGMFEGVWICTFEEFKGLCVVLRQGIIDVNNAVATQENKGDKMVMLYDFLTGNEFKAQVDAIVEGFTQMRENLNKERMVAMKNFSEREKQIDKVITNTVSMYGSIKGIAGNAIQDIKALEMGEE